MKMYVFCLLFMLPGILNAVELQNVKPLTSKTSYCIAPRWSPTGKLYCSIQKYVEIIEVNLQNGALKSVSSGAGCGFGFVMTPGGSIFCKKVFPSGRQLWRIDPAGNENWLITSASMGLPAWYNGAIRVQTSDGLISWTEDGAVTDHPADGWIYQDGDAIFRLQEEEPPQRLSPEGVRCCLPVISPDGSRLVYEALGRGLMLTDLEAGKTQFLGTGNNACWSSDGSFLLFDRTVDDGHRLTRGDIMMVDRNGSSVTDLTANLDLIVTHPAISPEGSRVAFEAEGMIWTAELK